MWFLLGFDSDTDPFVPPTWLGCLLPAGIILVSLIFDLVSAVPHPRLLRALWAWLSSPFRNFLTLEDLQLEPVDRTPQDSQSTTRILVGVSNVALVGWVGCLMFSAYMHDRDAMVESLVYSVSWCYIALTVMLRPPSTPPFFFIIFSVASSLLSLAAFGHAIFEGDNRNAVLYFISLIVPVAFAWAAGTLPLNKYRPSLNVAGVNDIPSIKLSCPEDNVNLWTWCSFSFIQPILDLALKRTLNVDDVWNLSPYFRHKNLFLKYLDNRTIFPSHSLIRFLISSNSLDLILDVTLEMWSATIGFVPSYALQQILAALKDNDATSKKRAYFWTLVTFIAHLTFAQKDLLKSWHTRRCYERTRGQLFCALHYKSLKRQEVSGRIQKEGQEKDADLGKILNLMQNDAYAVAQRFWEFSGIFTSPIRIAVALTFLYQILGWSALSGVVVVLVSFLLNYPLMVYDVSVTKHSLQARDYRLGVVNELLQNIRFLKFYGWEYQWSRKAQEARETELGWRITKNVIDTAVNFIWVWMPSATALTSFMCYTLLDNKELTVSKAFTSIALFSQLQTPMVALPNQILAMLNAYVSMRRIEDFLNEGEVPDWASTLNGNSADPVIRRDDEDREIGFSEASFEWVEASSTDAVPSRFHLGPLNISFPAGKLTIVSGATGSGKSALLVALLGEMHCSSGKVSLDKTGHQVAYCAQNPWLEHASIRDNIIFGSPFPFNELRYQSVLDACALRQDLSIFNAGDMTEIGEKGITLSGGQRARIALARAMYSQAKCILLDDPLAAVDMHTAQHLVSNCFSGNLAHERTIILVTHHITLCLPVAAYIVELNKGAVLYQGTIPELEEKGHLLRVIAVEDEPFTSTPKVAPEVSPVDVGVSASVQRREHVTDGILVEAENRAEGRVSLRHYITYIRASGVWCWILVVISIALIRAINIGSQLFLAKWTRAYETSYPGLESNLTNTITLPWDGLPPPTTNVKPWLMIYFYISAVGAFSLLFHIILGYYTSLQGSRSLFFALLKRLTRAPARFFDVTPIGRILNRFTTDIAIIDGAAQNSVRGCLTGIFNFLASCGTILVIVPVFTPFACVIAWLYVRLAPHYIQASRDLRRLESVSLSPAFAGFDELLRGIIHVRAFGMENRYQNTFYNRVDTFQSFDHVYWLVNIWIQWRYDCLGAVVVFAATFFALWQNVEDGLAAIVIVQAASFADATRLLVKVAAQVELDFNSVERIVEYLDVPQEAPAIIEKNRPPAYWPSSSGSLVVENLVVQYAPKLPAVLHNISFTVHPSEKIGIVGRTGSGKSTLAMSLLRMIEPTEGRIVIDGIDISILGLEDLRTRVTIVSQDVSLFSGTIRSNLDPLGLCTEEECLQVLDRCRLTPLLNHKPSEEEPTFLDMKVNQSSMSAGEKQLLALARATLRRTNIIIMDEATSQIDSNLDDQIQETIREELSGAIVITIAHRLKTVMDYDRILVLDDGRVVEFDTPEALLARANGHFRNMCRNSVDWPMFARMVGTRSQRSSREPSQ